MKQIVVLVILASLAIAVGAVLEADRRAHQLPLVDSGHPVPITPASAQQPAWRLFTPCPVGPRNIPILPDERTA